MKKRWIIVSLLVSMLGSVCGCKATEQEPDHTEEFSYKIADELVAGDKDFEEEENPGLSKEEEAVLAGMTNLPAGVNGFAFHMYEQLGEDDDFFFSPYSLCAALSMLNLGADAKTKAEIEEVLGITDFEAWSTEMQIYLKRQWTDDTYVTTANAVWMDKNEEFSDTIEEAFLEPAETYYQSELHMGDFINNPSAVTEEINKWVKENTKGMIPKLVNELPQDSVLALLNAVYFDGKWDNAFEEDGTYEDTFYGTEGESLTDMMHQYNEKYAYIEYEDIKGVSLPYTGDEVVMKVFVSVNEDENVATLFDKLSDTEKQALLDELENCGKTELRQLAIPKFTMEKSIEGLPDILAGMGIKTAFDPDSANFDVIAADLYISEIVHKAKIEVEEEGTRAAAATVIFANTATAVEEPKYYEFVADRPFIYVLQDTKTGMILFMGRVNNL